MWRTPVRSHSTSNRRKVVIPVGFIRRVAGIIAAGAALSLAIFLIVTLVRGQTQPQPESPAPKRVLPLPTSTAPPSTRPTPVPDNPAPQDRIDASAITAITIPAIGVNAKASGPIVPEMTERCKASEKCMDPPLLDQIAWSDGYGLPESPSTDAVLVYGHSNASSRTAQVFNDLGALVTNDKVVLTTKTGRFTYTVTQDPLLIPFEDIPWRKSLYKHTPGRLVMFTCNLSGGSYDTSAVVTAVLTKSEPL